MRTTISYQFQFMITRVLQFQPEFQQNIHQILPTFWTTVNCTKGLVVAFIRFQHVHYFYMMSKSICCTLSNLSPNNDDLHAVLCSILLPSN